MLWGRAWATLVRQPPGLYHPCSGQTGPMVPVAALVSVSQEPAAALLRWPTLWSKTKCALPTHVPGVPRVLPSHLVLGATCHPRVALPRALSPHVRRCPGCMLLLGAGRRPECGIKRRVVGEGGDAAWSGRCVFHTHACPPCGVVLGTSSWVPPGWSACVVGGCHRVRPCSFGVRFSCSISACSGSRHPLTRCVDGPRAPNPFPMRRGPDVGRA